MTTAFAAFVAGSLETERFTFIDVGCSGGIDPAWRLFIVTGLLGALTTFSSFSAEAIDLLQQGREVTAMLHAGLHLFGSLLLAWLGVLSGQTWWAKGT